MPKVGHDVRRGKARLAERSETGLHHVRFAYDYDRRYFPVAGDGYRLGLDAHLVAEGEGVLREVDPRDAPVAISLRHRDPSLGTLDVRLHDGKLIRPLRAPGSWSPCDLATFLDAAGGDVSWRDCPFASEATRKYVKRPRSVRETYSMSSDERRWDGPGDQRERHDLCVQGAVRDGPRRRRRARPLRRAQAQGREGPGRAMAGGCRRERLRG